MGFQDNVGKASVEILKAAGNEMQKKNAEIETAYERGWNMNDEALLRAYRNAWSATEKMGYAKAIKERFTKEELREFRRQGKI